MTPNSSLKTVDIALFSRKPSDSTEQRIAVFRNAAQKAPIYKY